MAGEGARRRTGGRVATKEAAPQTRKPPAANMRVILPTTSTRKRKRTTSGFEVNGQQFPSDFDAALYIVLESKNLTLRSFMDAALQEQKRLAKQNWKLALLQDHSLKTNKYGGRQQSEMGDAPTKGKKHGDPSSDDAMSMDAVSTDSDSGSLDGENGPFVTSLEDCTSEEEDARPEAVKRRGRLQRRSNASTNNAPTTEGNVGRAAEEESAVTTIRCMSENEATTATKPEDHKSGADRDMFSAEYQNRLHCEYCHERGERRLHPSTDGDSVKVSYHCGNDKCVKGHDKYIGWALEPSAKNQTSLCTTQPALRKLQASASTAFDLSQLQSNFQLTGSALLATMQKIKPDAENKTLCPFCEQIGTEMVKDHAVIYLCLNRLCPKLSNATHVQKIIGWRASSSSPA